MSFLLLTFLLLLDLSSPGLPGAQAPPKPIPLAAVRDYIREENWFIKVDVVKKKFGAFFYVTNARLSNKSFAVASSFCQSFSIMGLKEEEDFFIEMARKKSSRKKKSRADKPRL